MRIFKFAFLALAVSGVCQAQDDLQWIVPESATASGHTVWAGQSYTGPASLSIDQNNTTGWTLNAMGWIDFDLGATRVIHKVRADCIGSVTNGNCVNIYIDGTKVISNHKCTSATSTQTIPLSSPRVGRVVRYETVALPHNEFNQIATWSEIVEFTVLVAPPSPPVLNLDSFYESPAGQALTVDATPTAGYPTNFSYQWHLNGFAIPPNFGGAASSYQISGVPSNNGTWLVVVTNSEGSAEASFEYRVFIDSDGDGLHDDDEVNIHGTNPNLSDTDGDGLSDTDEINTHKTNPSVADSDGDGLFDGIEINTHGTNPLAADSSGDGLADGLVVNAGFDPKSDYSALLTASALNALGYYTSSQIVDARAGSMGIIRDGNSVTLQLQIQRSEDLETWTSHQDDLISVPLNMTGDNQFLRFAMPRK